MARAAARLSGWSADRQTHLINQMRGDVDRFEAALAKANLLNNADAGRVVGILRAPEPTQRSGIASLTCSPTRPKR